MKPWTPVWKTTGKKRTVECKRVGNLFKIIISGGGQPENKIETFGWEKAWKIYWKTVDFMMRAAIGFDTKTEAKRRMTDSGICFSVSKEVIASLKADYEDAHGPICTDDDRRHFEDLAEAFIVPDWYKEEV